MAETVVIDHVGHFGDGVAPSPGGNVYVPYTLGGETVEVAPGILWARIPLPFRLNHINVYLIDDGATVKRVNITTGKQIWLRHVGLLSASTSPRIMRASLRDMDRPRPVPPNFRVVELSAC